jgi:hypothetical protein
MKNSNKSSKTAKKITKLSDLEQTDGRLIEQPVGSTKLEILLGADGLGKYGTLDKAEYVSKLESFNTAEIRDHAIRAGLIPISDITRLKKQLLVEFDKYALAYKTPTKFTTQQLSKEKQKIGLEIMSAAK